MANKWWTGKKTKKAEKSNNITDIVDSEVVEEVIAEVISDSKDKKTDKFILLWLLGYSAKAAALSVGYAKSYAESGIQKRLKTPKLRERLEQITQVMPERYRSLCRLRLADVAEIESGVLEAMKTNPDKALRHPQILKQIKQSSGALADEGIIQEKISIGTLNLIQSSQRDLIERRLEFFEEKPEDISPKAFQTWLSKKKITLKQPIDITPEQGEASQEEDA